MPRFPLMPLRNVSAPPKSNSTSPTSKRPTKKTRHREASRGTNRAIQQRQIHPRRHSARRRRHADRPRQIHLPRRDQGNRLPRHPRLPRFRHLQIRRHAPARHPRLRPPHHPQLRPPQGQPGAANQIPPRRPPTRRHLNLYPPPTGPLSAHEPALTHRARKPRIQPKPRAV